MTAKNDVAYLVALAKCGKASLVSRYRLKHCAKRNHAGKQAITGLIDIKLSTQKLASARYFAKKNKLCKL